MSRNDGGLTLAEVFHPAGQSRKIAFTLAEVFHPAGQSRKIAFTLAEVFHPVGQSRKIAFTLAEVLITLGIIGVVAALTMPSLIQNYKKRVYANRAKQAYSMISQAIKLSEIDNGEVKYWNSMYPDISPANTKLFLEKLILPYLKTEYCGEGNKQETIKKCGATVSMNGQNYFLANGVSVGFVPMSFSNDTAFLHVMIDVNGPKGENSLSTDNFYFEYVPEKGFIPFGADSGCSRTEILNGTCVYHSPSFGAGGKIIACKKNKNEDTDDIYYRHGCTYLLMMDGWEFKDDYPFKL